MGDIKKVIAKNLILLRKSHGLTQNKLAEKLSYSDNMVSRWERGEIAPSIETLEKISEFYKVPIESLIKPKSTTERKTDNYEKKEAKRRFSLTLILVLFIWFISCVTFVYMFAVFNKSNWILFVFDVPLSCAILLLYKPKSDNNVYHFVVLTVLLWSFLSYLYLLFIDYHIFLLFLIGIPVQLILVIWAFITPRKLNKIQNNESNKE